MGETAREVGRRIINADEGGRQARPMIGRIAGRRPSRAVQRAVVVASALLAEDASPSSPGSGLKI